MSYTIESLARHASLNEADARSRIRQLGILPNLQQRYSERDLQRVKAFQSPTCAGMVPDREISLGAAATRLGVRPEEVHRLIASGELRGGRWEGMGRYAGFVTVSENSVEAYARKRQQASQEPSGAVEAPKSAPVPTAKTEPLELPPVPVLNLEESFRPFGSVKRAASAIAQGFAEVLHG